VLQLLDLGHPVFLVLWMITYIGMSVFLPKTK
jgi:hypothetical protein